MFGIATGWTIWCSNPSRTRALPLPTDVETGFGAHQNSCSMGTRFMSFCGGGGGGEGCREL
jgi:hypothetical protein